MKVVDRFKRRILDLAIRGKLVPQDPNDEPASELLARIRAKKTEDERGGRCRKGKRSAVGSDGAAYEKSVGGDFPHTEVSRLGAGRVPSSAPADAPFELPDGWVWCRLGEIGSWKAGSTPSRKENRYYLGGDIPWLKTGDLNDGIINAVPECITTEAVSETSVRLNPIGSVLIAMYGATIGKIGLLGIGATTNQACCACIVGDEVYNKYLFYFLMARRGHFKALGGGGAQPNISKDIIVSYPFPLPPFPEQRRIVASIEELFEAADSLGRAADGLAETAKRLDRKILDLAIRGKLVPQDPTDEPASELLKRIAAASHKSPCQNQDAPIDPLFNIPKSWEWCRLGKISDYGHCRSVDVQSVPMDTWSLDLEEIEKETGHLLVRKTVADKKPSSNKHLFCKGMVLYSKLRTYLNKVLVADMDGVCTSEIIPISLGDGIDPEYIRLVLMSPYLVQYTTSKGYGVKMPRVGTTDMREAPIPVPPSAEQRRIVERVYELKHIASSLTTL